MAVAVASSSTQASNSLAAGGVIIAKPSVITAGDLLLAFIANDSTTALNTTPSGWTQAGTTVTNTGPAGTLTAWTKTATGSEPTNYTWANGINGSSVNGCIFDLTGALTSTPSPIVNGGNNTATTTLTAPTVTPTAAGGMLFTPFDGASAAYTYSIPSGMTSVTGSTASINDGYLNLAVFYVSLATTAATGTTSTTSTSQTYNSMSLIVEPSASSHGQPGGNWTARMRASNW